MFFTMAELAAAARELDHRDAVRLDLLERFGLGARAGAALVWPVGMHEGDRAVDGLVVHAQQGALGGSTRTGCRRRSGRRSACRRGGRRAAREVGVGAVVLVVGRRRGRSSRRSRRSRWRCSRPATTTRVGQALADGGEAERGAGGRCGCGGGSAVAGRRAPVRPLRSGSRFRCRRRKRSAPAGRGVAAARAPTPPRSTWRRCRRWASNWSKWGLALSLFSRSSGSIGERSLWFIGGSVEDGLQLRSRV